MIPLLVITFINMAIVIRIKALVHEFYGTVFASSIPKWGSTESEKKNKANNNGAGSRNLLVTKKKKYP